MSLYTVCWSAPQAALGGIMNIPSVIKCKSLLFRKSGNCKVVIFTVFLGTANDANKFEASILPSTFLG